MYTIVLMTAMVTTTATPNWGHRGHGCCYTAQVGCTYQGGFACQGCNGCGGGHVQGYGAAGGCYGYHGGCYGAFGNNYMGAYDNYMNSYMVSGTGCYGCYGGYSCFGVPLPGPLPNIKPPIGNDPFPPINPDGKKDPKEEPVPGPKEKDKKPAEKKLQDVSQARAMIRIEVPQGGKLYVDGQHINVGAGTRTFQTPILAAGERYFYDIRIEIDDRSEERRVVIGPGQDGLVSFPSLRSSGTLAAKNR